MKRKPPVSVPDLTFRGLDRSARTYGLPSLDPTQDRTRSIDARHPRPSFLQARRADRRNPG